MPSVSIPEFIFGELRKTTLGQVGMVAIYALEYALYAALHDQFGRDAHSPMRALRDIQSESLG